MRTAYRMLGTAASCAALIGLFGCQEDNEKNVLSNSEGKVDPRAPSSYEQTQPKPVTNPAAAAIAPLVKSGGPAMKSNAPAPDTSK